MLPSDDIRGEHSAMKIILLSMKNLSYDLLVSNKPNLCRISQIADFLATYINKCHYEKEEKGLFAALLELDNPLLTKTIHRLIAEHTIARGYIEELVVQNEKYLNGQYVSYLNISTSLSDFVSLEAQHMRTEDMIILPYCEKLLSGSRLRSIAADLKLIQDEQIGTSKNFEYYKLFNQLYSESKRIII